MILKRMKRRHLRGDSIAFCEKVRSLRPDIVFGADLIAGFPTETDEMFNDSLSIIDSCGLTYLHVFPYSEREGTPAARMPSMPMSIRRDRAKLLREHGSMRVASFLKSQIGRKVSVLVEKDGKGRTEQFAPISIPGQPPGALISAHVTGIRDNEILEGMVA
jgi:threonylcarbamoyladenosine tRNA methylthiotransferase MtaB